MRNKEKQLNLKMNVGRCKTGLFNIACYYSPSCPQASSFIALLSKFLRSERAMARAITLGRKHVCPQSPLTLCEVLSRNKNIARSKMYALALV